MERGVVEIFAAILEREQVDQIGRPGKAADERR